jgi:hypothetical protein
MASAIIRLCRWREITDAQTSNEFSIAYLKRSIAAQEERIIAGLMKGVDTVEMEDRLQGDLAVLHRIQRESSSNRQADGLACAMRFRILSTPKRGIGSSLLPLADGSSPRLRAFLRTWPRGAAHPQCDMKQATGEVSSRARVTPPKIHSRMRLWP